MEVKVKEVHTSRAFTVIPCDSDWAFNLQPLVANQLILSLVHSAGLQSSTRSRHTEADRDKKLCWTHSLTRIEA